MSRYRALSYKRPGNILYKAIMFFYQEWMEHITKEMEDYCGNGKKDT